MRDRERRWRDDTAVTPPPIGRIVGEEMEDAACGVAVQRGARSPQDLDPTHRAQFEGVDLGLSIGERFGQTVDQYGDLTDAEGGPCAETADLDPEILGEVSAVLHEGAGDAAQ